MKKTLRLILGDQLNADHSWFHTVDDSVLYLIAELKQETDYVRHHVQKVCAFFIAMNMFADKLSSEGHHVLRLTLDDTPQDHSLADLLRRVSTEHSVTHIEYQRPDEYRLLTQLESLEFTNIEVTQVDAEHFYLPFDEIGQYFKAGKATRLENFYRKMRLRFNVMVDDKKPWGERWNFDADNRNKLKNADLPNIPEPILFRHKVDHILARLKKHKVATIGTVDSHLTWPCTPEEARETLNYFCEHLLQRFGTFQDAMTDQSHFAWSLYHSRLSFALNAKLIKPATVVERVIEEYNRSDTISLAQVEGFVRQILGWREFVRGIYWVNMPQYRSKNALSAKRQLPDFFWSGNTNMNCVSKVISQSLNYAYAHHIQRLMVTGNFCLLTGIDPAEVDEWYLGIYIDAIEWVELPNTRGMSQFADGGIVASKPYAASGAYINRMSDYCRSCRYDVKLKTGERACPLNSLYWRFMNLHRDKIGKNPRNAFVYKNWDKMGSQTQGAILDYADHLLENIDKI